MRSGAVTLSDSTDGLTPTALEGFFVGWPTPPSTARRLEILEASTYVSVAWTGKDQVAGFIAAIGDGTFAAYISLLEVCGPFQGQGIGTALTQRMLARLSGYYMVDLICDQDLLAFYERFGMTRYTGAVVRNPAALESRARIPKRDNR
jgi:ribosomal protein S18 acetylase RimI-like enzyme